MTPDRAVEITKIIYCNDCQDEEECEDCIHGLAIEALKKQSIYEQIKWERDVALEQLESIGVGLGRKMDDVKEAMEKQIPKKVEYGNDNSWGVNKKVPVCPVCDYFLTQTYFIGNGQKITYCDHCGQKIDWSEEE
jgi:hypothetical protein